MSEVSLAELLLGARSDPIAVPSTLWPASAAAAEAVQWQQVARHRATAFKVARVGNGAASWGAIFARDVHDAPELLEAAGPLRAEVEVGFVLARDLADLPASGAFTRDEVAEALAGAFLGVELLARRLAPADTPHLALADRLGNHALVHGAALVPAAPFLSAGPFEARLSIGGETVVNGPLPHPSGVDPLHPLVWLASHLAAQGRGLVAGTRVITGAFGGAHPVVPGARIEASIAGLGQLSFTLAPAVSSGGEVALRHG